MNIGEALKSAKGAAMNSIGLYNGVSTHTPIQNDDAVNNELASNTASDVKKASTVDSTNTATETSAKDNLTLSTRAQKLHAISSEFFSDGNFTNVDSRKLAARVHELGLISDQEYQGLTGSQLFKQEQTAQATKTSSLVDYLQSFKAKLPEQNEEALGDNKQQFIEGIDKATNILKDVESAKLSPTFKSDLTQSLSSLKSLESTPFYQTLSDNEKSNISDSVLALEVINRISPQRLTNSQVNRYLDFAS